MRGDEHTPFEPNDLRPYVSGRLHDANLLQVPTVGTATAVRTTNRETQVRINTE